MKRALRHLGPDDAAALLGLLLITIGAFLAWPPAAFLVLGFTLLAIVRYLPEE